MFMELLKLPAVTLCTWKCPLYIFKHFADGGQHFFGGALVVQVKRGRVTVPGKETQALFKTFAIRVDILHVVICIMFIFIAVISNFASFGCSPTHFCFIYGICVISFFLPAVRLVKFGLLFEEGASLCGPDDKINCEGNTRPLSSSDQC